jgi:tungstate transport system ATP-binding protein
VSLPEAYRLVGVSVVHAGRVILDLPKFEVMRGEVLCLIGPPGAGKSTLLRLLAGLDSPTSGSLFLGEERLDGEKSPVPLRRRVTLVFQRPMLLAGTVRANVEFGLRIRGEADHATRATQLLKRVGLMKLADRPAHAVSGGEAQLIALARALAFRPEVLLLDEPTNNLDPARVGLVEEIVMEDHRERGTTVVWATHNHFQARRVGDRVALLLDGRCVEVAEATSFFDTPNDPRSAAFVQGKMVY